MLFWKYDPLMVKFSKFCSESFHRDTNRRVALKFREIWVTGNSEIVRCLPNKKTKFRLALQLLLLHGSRPKSVRASPNNVLRVLQISSKSVHFRRRYSRTHEHRQSESNIWLKPSFEPNNYNITIIKFIKIK